MNQKASEEFGLYYARIPLKCSPHILHGNALTIDWTKVIAPEECSYILGNPPFVGKKEQTKEQKAEITAIFGNVKGAGVLDYVTAWYLKAADMMSANKTMRAAFVSTNSVTQGEQPGIFWPPLWKRNVAIIFAHRTFAWTNEAPGKAAVHCVIVGFGVAPAEARVLFDYEHVRGEPAVLRVSNLNPYLVDAPDIVLSKRSSPLESSTPAMLYGSMPIDKGHLIVSSEERKEALEKEPGLARYIRPYVGGEELINGGERWCLWLVDAPPTLVRESPFLKQRVARVKAFREDSERKETIALAATPTLFGEIRQPSVTYLLIPKVSSERRMYMPMASMRARSIASGSGLIVPGASNYHFGVLTSMMHMAWMRSVCGRMKSDYQYSAGIVYNNLPWPNPTDKQRAAIEKAAQGVLDARAAHPGATLADLYDPVTMPPNLVKAHQKLDAVVDAAYGFKGTLESARVAFLFARYQKLTSLLPGPTPTTPPKRRARG